MISQDSIYTTIVRALTALGDAAGTFTLRKSTNVFNPATSEMTTTTVDTSGKGVLDESTVRYLDEQTQTGSYVLLWFLTDTVPVLEDTIIDSSGNSHRIIVIDKMRSNTKTHIYRIGLEK